MTVGNMYFSKQEAQAIRLEHDFGVDANLDKPEWKSALPVILDRNCLGVETYTDIRTEAMLGWTRRYLYVAFRCPYSALNMYEGEEALQERVGLWDRDVVEVFLNPQPNRVKHYYEFEVAPNNQWIDLEIDWDKDPFYDWTWDSGFEHATCIKTTPREWTCEMRIPAAALGVSELVADCEWRLNLFRIDGSGDDSERRFLCWSATLRDTGIDFFHVPERFGKLVLKDQSCV